jgi:PAS domain-containing protein
MDALKSLVDRCEAGVKKFISSDYGEDIELRIEQSRKVYEELETRMVSHVNGFKSFHERASMLEYIVDHMSVAVCVFDMDSKYIYANDRYASMYGIAMENIIGHNVEEVCGEVVWSRVKENHMKVINGESLVEDYDLNDSALHSKFNVQYYPYYNGGVKQVGYFMIASIMESENVAGQ